MNNPLPARRRRARLLATLALAAIMLGACGSPRRGEPIVGTFDVANTSVQRGKVAFDRHCYLCHANGEGAMGPTINNLPLPKALMRLQIRAGLGVMPSFSEQELSDRDMNDIVNYLVALRHHGK